MQTEQIYHDIQMILWREMVKQCQNIYWDYFFHSERRSGLYDIRYTLNEEIENYAG